MAEWNYGRTVAPWYTAVTAWEQEMPPVPTDPFDFKPLKYRREGTGFVIYSVGKTGKYDGARLPEKHAMEWAFRYPS